jgi:RimJ/RimL family protein N-acetyltransferase
MDIVQRSESVDTVRLSDGTDVAIRPIRPDDGPRLSAAYDRLSPEARYRRFLGPKPHLNASEVRYLVDVDGANHIALVATLVDHPDQIIGVARCVRLREDQRAAEFAVVIGDPWQGEGLASEMLGRLVRAAGDRGIDRLRAIMLADNEPAHRLVRHLAHPQTVSRRGAVNEIEVDLAA